MGFVNEPLVWPKPRGGRDEPLVLREPGGLTPPGSLGSLASRTNPRPGFVDRPELWVPFYRNP